VRGLVLQVAHLAAGEPDVGAAMFSWLSPDAVAGSRIAP
jgi:hypothetical protein